VPVQICRLVELWVVVEALALKWKGGRGWGCSSACPNWVVAEVLALEWKGGRKWGYVCVGIHR